MFLVSAPKDASDFGPVPWKRIVRISCAKRYGTLGGSQRRCFGRCTAICAVWMCRTFVGIEGLGNVQVERTRRAVQQPAGIEAAASGSHIVAGRAGADQKIYGNRAIRVQFLAAGGRRQSLLTC